MPGKVTDLDVFGFRFRRTLSRKGVLFLAMRYTNHKHVFEILDAAGRGTVKVDMFVDPADMKSVTVVCPTTNRRLRLGARDPELADVTLWERRLHLAWMRRKNYDLADRERWLIAKKEMRDAWTARARARGRIAARQQAARGLGIGSRGTTPQDPTILTRILEGDDDPWIESDFAPTDDGEPDEAVPTPVPDAPGRPPAAVRRAVAKRKVRPAAETRPDAGAEPPPPSSEAWTDAPAPTPTRPADEPPAAGPAPDPDATGGSPRERLRARIAASRTPSLSRA